MDAQSSHKAAAPLSFLGSGSQAASARWYWNRLRCMSAPEIGHRLRQRLSSQLQQLGLGTALVVPEPDLSSTGAKFAATPASLAVDAYVEAADRILAGQWRLFGRDYHLGATPDWNRDPKTGRHAARDSSAKRR